MQLQVTIPAFGASIALVLSAAFLSASSTDPSATFRSSWMSLRERRGSLLAAAASAALMSFVLTLLPFGLLIALLLVHGIYGPPLIAQAIGAERITVPEAWRTVRRSMAGSGLRVALYLLNAVVGTGIVAVLLIGGVAYATYDAPQWLRIIAASLWQALVLGCAIGFLACVEFSLYRSLSAAGAGTVTADATTD